VLEDREGRLARVMPLRRVLTQSQRERRCCASFPHAAALDPSSNLHTLARAGANAAFPRKPPDACRPWLRDAVHGVVVPGTPTAGSQSRCAAQTTSQTTSAFSHSLRGDVAAVRGSCRHDNHASNQSLSQSRAELIGACTPAKREVAGASAAFPREFSVPRVARACTLPRMALAPAR